MQSFTHKLNQKILNIKDKKRSNLFAWRGQFSPQLVESLLEAYCPSDSTVLDPFAGSGTVLHESGKKNFEAYACEINPAARAFSKTYEFINIPTKKREEYIRNLFDLVIEEFSFDVFEQSILENQEIENRIDRIGSLVSDLEKTILNTLVISLDLFNNQHTGESIQKRFSELATLIRSLPYSDRTIKTFLADSRNIPLEDEIIDFIVTSPPYINVFNYHQNYRKSAEALGWDLLKVARSEIGSNRANRGNRYLTVIQYCLDMAMCLVECARVLKSDGKAIFIVGCESNVLGVPFYNSSIVSELIKKISGLGVVQTQQRSFKNKFGKVIREDLIHFVKEVSYDHTRCLGILKVARDVAKQELSRGLELVEDKNRSSLLSAIKATAGTKPTRLFNNNYSNYHTKDFVMMVEEAYSDESAKLTYSA